MPFYWTFVPLFCYTPRLPLFSRINPDEDAELKKVLCLCYIKTLLLCFVRNNFRKEFAWFEGLDPKSRSFLLYQSTRIKWAEAKMKNEIINWNPIVKLSVVLKCNLAKQKPFKRSLNVLKISPRQQESQEGLSVQLMMLYFADISIFSQRFAFFKIYDVSLLLLKLNDPYLYSFLTLSRQRPLSYRNHSIDQINGLVSIW